MFSAWCHLTYVVFSAAFHLPRRSDVGTGKDHAAVARSRLEPGHCSTCGSLSEPQILHMGSTKFYSFTTVYMHCCHLGLWRWVWCFFSYSNYQVGNLTWGAIPVEYSHTNEAENQLLNIYSSLVLHNFEPLEPNWKVDFWGSPVVYGSPFGSSDSLLCFSSLAGTVFCSVTGHTVLQGKRLSLQ